MGRTNSNELARHQGGNCRRYAQNSRTETENNNSRWQKKKRKANQDLLKGHRQNSKRRKLQNQRHMFKMDGEWYVSLSAVQQSQKFFTSLGARTHTSKHTAGGCGAADLLHTAHNHAQVGRFHDNTNATGLEDLGDCQGNLLGHTFLDLKSPSEHLCQTSQLGETKHAAVRDVPNMHLWAVNIHCVGYMREFHTFPVKGTMWCSHSEKTSISLTITSSSWSSWKTAPFIRSRTFSSYPLVKKSIALAYLMGVSRRPSRSGSSPMHSRIVRIAPESLSSRSSVSSGVASFRCLVPGPEWRCWAVIPASKIRYRWMSLTRPAETVKVDRRVQCVRTSGTANGGGRGQCTTFIPGIAWRIVQAWAKNQRLGNHVSQDCNIVHVHTALAPRYG